MNLLRTTTGKLFLLVVIWVVVSRLSWLFVPGVPWEGAKIGGWLPVALPPGGAQVVHVPVRVHEGSLDDLHLNLRSPVASRIRLLVFDDPAYQSWQQGHGGTPLHDSMVELPGGATVRFPATKATGPDLVIDRYVVLSNPDRATGRSFEAEVWSGPTRARGSIVQRVLFVFLVVGAIFGAILMGLRTKKPQPEGGVYAVPPNQT